MLFIYITRLASNEIFSPSHKIHREVGRAKDLSALVFKVYAPECHAGTLRRFRCVVWLRQPNIDFCVTTQHPCHNGQEELVFVRGELYSLYTVSCLPLYLSS